MRVLLVNPDYEIERYMGRHFGRMGWVMPPMGLLYLAAALEKDGIDPRVYYVASAELFDLLPHAARRADGSQRSLRATVEWSDALLPEDERRLLRRMAVFAGGFDLAAINAVCASEGQSAAKVAGLTGRLVEKSLLLKHEATGQYQMLETIR